MANANELGPLRQNCIACHGGIKDGKKVVKGSFDITSFLKDGIQEKHAGDWVAMLDQIREKEMPPDDSKYTLSDAQRKAVAKAVYVKLDRGDIQERLLTPFEIANTSSKLFGLDLEIYDPFENLYFLENIDSSYPTVDSPALMSSAYMREIESSLDLVLDRTVANGFSAISSLDKKYKDQTTFELRFVTTFTSEQRDPSVYQAYVHREPTVPHTKEARQALNDKEKESILKQENRKVADAFWKHIRETENIDQILVRKRGATRLACKEYGVNLPAGRYTLTFSARMLNRDLVKKVAETEAKDSKKGVGSFRELHHAKAGLAIRHNGINHSRRGSLKANSKSGKLLHYFEIEDDVKKEYQCEFELTTPGQIEMDFVNGPIFERLNRLSLGEQNTKEYERDAYPLPHIAIDSKLLLKRISGPAPYNSYQLTAGEPAAALKQKLNQLLGELSLADRAAELLAVHDRLDKLLTPEQKYVETLKWISMSQDQLYIRLDRNAPNARARFASYSLLKKHPDASFKADYTQFQAGQITARDFADKIIKRPGFKDFLTVFAKYWLENRTRLDEKKFSEVDLKLPFEKETIDYMSVLFDKNRPVAELFTSDYRVLTAAMGSFYGMSEQGLKRHKPRLVKTPGAGGLLQQANFFVAQSDGVDPRPFRRAKWILANVFGHDLREPPGDINAELFIANAETLTFEQRTVAHREHKSCRSCHEALDPIAFAVNDYDTIGRMTGTASKEAKQNLTAKLSTARETMARSFTRNLIAFTIGRDTNIHDMKTTETILDKTAKDGHRVRDILAEILSSYFKI
ncbi:MAG: DUF1588 domain-containing protein [Opitutae bacterium]|nr:DUF1588 domain-containing protein [Opitutae bacterium]